jgi:hypothetical protein
MFGEGADRFGEFRTGLDSFGQNAKSHKVALELERLGSIGSLSLGSWSLWKVSADGQRFEEGWADSGRHWLVESGFLEPLEGISRWSKIRRGLGRFGETREFRNLGQTMEWMSRMWEGLENHRQVFKCLDRFGLVRKGLRRSGKGLTG